VILLVALVVVLAGGLAIEAKVTSSSNASADRSPAGSSPTTVAAATTATPTTAARLVVKHANIVPGSYATEVGITPAPGACGDDNPQVVANAMATVVNTGVGMIRCDLNWWNVQPKGPTQFNWTEYDNVVNAAYDSGLTVMFVPEYTPPWASPKPLPPNTKPSHVAPVHDSDYVNFVKAAVERYSPVGTKRAVGVRGSVRTWEIWNEPNIPGFWNPVDPARYGALLKATAPAIKAIDNKATVISGGLAPADNTKGQIAPDVFVTNLAASGALDVIDGVGVHPYTFPAWPNEPLKWNPFYGVVPRIHTIMATFGAGNKKIWATEIGWPTASLDPQTFRSDGTHVGTDAYQSQEIPATIKTWLSFSYAGPIIIYEQVDLCNNIKSWWCSSGLEHVNGTPKPALAVMAKYLTHKLGT
jgi:hypothetical protein